MKTDFDVICLGGGPASTLFAISILRKRPNTKVLIIEKSMQFPKKAGETTSDLAALFLRRFDIDKILNKQLTKSGLRFYFNDGINRDLDKSSDYSGPSFPSQTNGLQLNRSEFDQDLLEFARECGAQVMRPATVLELTDNRVKVKRGPELSSFSGKWIVDGSGRRRILARKKGWHKEVKDLKTSAIWGHFTLKEGEEFKSKKSNWPSTAIGPSCMATEHFLGHGHWVWKIPLNTGQYSIGLVYDNSLINPLISNKAVSKVFTDFLAQHSLLSSFAKNYSVEKVFYLPHLPYLSQQYMQNGFVTLGDASAFVDPLFSPGLETLGQQILTVTPIIKRSLDGKKIQRNIRRYNKLWRNVFESRFNLYKDRYKVMGNYRLFSIWTQMDFLGYLCAHALPSVLFKFWLRQPARFNFFNQWIYRRFSARYIKLEEGEIDSKNLGQRSQSYFKIPYGPGKFFSPFMVFGALLKRYLAIELGQLFIKKDSPQVLHKES